MEQQPLRSAPEGAFVPQYSYPATYAPVRSTNGFAIASMVLGILWVWWIGSILALVFGYIARGQIKERGDGGNGMAIAGIVLGWIGAATLAGMILLIALGSSNSGY